MGPAWSLRMPGIWLWWRKWSWAARPSGCRFELKLQAVRMARIYGVKMCQTTTSRDQIVADTTLSAFHQAFALTKMRSVHCSFFRVWRWIPTSCRLCLSAWLLVRFQFQVEIAIDCCFPIKQVSEVRCHLNSPRRLHWFWRYCSRAQL